ncbi:uncharacterized protein HD556DRAFT_1415689 [Suillus plorans]|uniref:Uncharacterized protein n=1 Tax=Suillus plorans TaxID=116603 RepID=A0A9P7AC75_9AGAM|nr:uncharacterized protein HD556DRAFT_1415689 [Suillus plorans]KAG1786367.1 hypothetical protein HD556DRAFT_1415689 [Suillus plorans]
MSDNLPKDGDGYKIQNVFYNTQHADLEHGVSAVGTPIIGHTDDGSSTGSDHRTFIVSYTGGAEDLVTIINLKSKTYASANTLGMKLEGNGSPVVYQLIESQLSQGEFIIRKQNTNYVWYLDSDSNQTQIRIVPAPAETDKKQYWKFVQQE